MTAVGARKLMFLAVVLMAALALVHCGKGLLTDLDPVNVHSPQWNKYFLFSADEDAVNSYVSVYSIDTSNGKLGSTESYVSGAFNTSAFSMAIDREGKFVFIAKDGTAERWVKSYSINQVTGELQLIDAINFNLNYSGFKLAINPRLNAVYVLYQDAANNYVSSRTYSADTGAFLSSSTIPFGGVVTSYDIGVKPDGTAVYATCSGGFYYLPVSGEGNVTSQQLVSIFPVFGRLVVRPNNGSVFGSLSGYLAVASGISPSMLSYSLSATITLGTNFVITGGDYLVQANTMFTSYTIGSESTPQMTEVNSVSIDAGGATTIGTHPNLSYVYAFDAGAIHGVKVNPDGTLVSIGSPYSTGVATVKALGIAITTINGPQPPSTPLN
ncbi:MAG: hypothetical protein A3K03_11235 [Bdellovibrionales bacterium RIFOXYD1_FULL_44_7]|nr:MAG: hypothetical protein A3K03_11235 [Bdellovibrionales bacterium RIFOXYD1_FULL_44_7]